MMLSIPLVCYGLMILTPFSVALAGESTPFVNSPVFASEETAVKAAADIYNPISIQEDREYMGTIQHREGGFYYSVTAGIVGNDSVSIRIPKSEWNHVIAFWHTHGMKEFQRRYFSKIDTALVNEHGMPFYLADYTGTLKVFRPGGRTLSRYKAVKLGLPKQEGFAIGEKVRDSSNRVIKVNTDSATGG